MVWSLYNCLLPGLAFVCLVWSLPAWFDLCLPGLITVCLVSSPSAWFGLCLPTFFSTRVFCPLSVASAHFRKAGGQMLPSAWFGKKSVCLVYSGRMILGVGRNLARTRWYLACACPPRRSQEAFVRVVPVLRALSGLLYHVIRGGLVWRPPHLAGN